MTVIGDIRIDVVSTLRTRRFAQLTHDHHEANGVAVTVGGTAMNFARAAAPHFAQVRVIAAIGDDLWSDIIWSAFEEIGMHARLEQHPGVLNGLVMIVRDAAKPDNPGGIRLMLAQKPSPYDHLDVQLIQLHEHVIATSDALVIDGYALLHTRSAAYIPFRRRCRPGHRDRIERRCAGQLRFGTAHNRPTASSPADRAIPASGVDQHRRGVDLGAAPTPAGTTRTVP